MKNILILAFNNIEETEFVAPRDLLKRAGHNVDVIVMEDTNTVTSSQGLVMTFDTDRNTLLSNLDKYDMLVMPGGPGADQVDSHKDLDTVINHFINNNKLIGSICAAPGLLAKRGHLAGFKATCHLKANPDLDNNGASRQEQNVVVDGRFITGNGVQASIEFGNKLVELLK